MPTSAFVDLSSYLTGGWTANDTVGGYLHRGTAYLSGSISNPGTPAVTSAILQNLPLAFRPLGEVALTIFVDWGGTDFTRDPALVLPSSYAATIKPDGTLSLDSPPPAQLSATPSAATYFWRDFGAAHTGGRYLFPMGVDLVLGDVRWPIAPTPDGFPSLPLAPYLGPDFTDIDSGYDVHGSRVHLTGSVRAAVDGAVALLRPPPPPSVVGLPGEVETLIGGFGARVNTSYATLDTDAPIKPAGEPPPLSYDCPFYGRWGANYNNGSVANDSSTVHVASGGALPSFTIDLSLLTAQCTPPPDWFVVLVNYDIGLPGASGAIATAGLAVLDDAGSPIPAGPGFDGWLSPPSSLYSGPSYLPFGSLFSPPGSDLGGRSFLITATDMIWKAGQEVTFTMSSSGTALAPGIDVVGGAFVFPCYERRQMGLHAGDVLVLDNSGWVGILALNPGTVDTLPAPPGVRRRGRILSGGSVGL